MTEHNNFSIKSFGICDYQKIWNEMQQFTENRQDNTLDEFWVLQHNPVFTLGLAGKQEHLLFTNHGIPIINCDRGGQVTYHGPGQLIVYIMLDLKRANLSIRELVMRIENGVIQYLAKYSIYATGNRDAPGVYVNGNKIASMGLKVRKGCTYHGLSFNVAMDTTPFGYINVCGYSGLKVAQLKEFIQINSIEEVALEVVRCLTDSVYQ
ncbi:MAG: lipoyl(octanoyl) transferase LipB [Proteobacteria bacterium]|jgi:lipoyl(octanoyl) transferase|nr:lipoyl(octanoyl) transferase LipB [Pseudomonadota bacterium]